MVGPPFQTKELWRHSHPERTKLHAFQKHVEKKYGLSFCDYKDFHKWSVSSPQHFWEEVLLQFSVRLHQPYLATFDTSAPMFPRPNFFPGCTLNFAENLLYPSANPDPESMAIIGSTDTTREYVSWTSLRERVRRCANAMRGRGLGKGDRVACYLANHANAVIVMLAATSMGAVWTGVSPDTGVSAVLDRLSQIEPVLLFADNAIQYNAKPMERLPKSSYLCPVSKLLSSSIPCHPVPSIPVPSSHMNLLSLRAMTPSFRVLHWTSP